MDAIDRIERALEVAVDEVAVSAPLRLVASVRHAVFPGGARIRPRLCLAVARACGEDRPAVTEAAASAIELLHCASLVHDDLPCFDDAATRRGRASVHKAFGEAGAVLAGDALIVLAFQVLAQGTASAPARLPGLLTAISSAVGMPFGIVAGQAWEAEPRADLDTYHRTKTASLFATASACGALAAGHQTGTWPLLGERLGEAYQVADDIRDVVCDADEIGKPIGQDAALGRCSAVEELGLDGAIRRLDRLIAEALAAIPACPGQAELRDAMFVQAQRFVPRDLARRAA